MTRLPPQGPPHAYQTFRLVSPRDVTVVAACEQVGCPGWRKGWDTIVDERTDVGMRRAAYIRSGKSGRSFRELPKRGDALTVFRFEAHQRCFAEHRTRPEAYGVLAGDWRRHGCLIRRHTRPTDFVEDIHETMDRTWDQKARG